MAFSLVVAAADGSEPEFSGSMLVEYGVTMEFRPSPSSARLFLNSIVSDSFISGLEASSEHWDYLRIFGDAAQFEKEGFSFLITAQKRWFRGMEMFACWE